MARPSDLRERVWAQGKGIDIPNASRSCDPVAPIVKEHEVVLVAHAFPPH